MKNAQGKTVIIQQNERIKIVTTEGKRYFGKINIISTESVVMRKDTLPFSSIVTIQKRSALKSAVSTILISGSSLLIPGGLAYVFVNSNTAGVLFSSGMIGLPTGILLPVFGKNYKLKKWNFQVVEP